MAKKQPTAEEVSRKLKERRDEIQRNAPWLLGGTTKDGKMQRLSGTEIFTRYDDLLKAKYLLWATWSRVAVAIAALFLGAVGLYIKLNGGL